MSRAAEMLGDLRSMCMKCAMCDLGAMSHAPKGVAIDPHVLSSMTPSRFMVLGQNPGYNECVQGEPFVGAAGGNFNREIEKHGLKRSDFYIANTVRCFTPENRSPDAAEMRACEPFLRMEIGILKPILVVTLGEPAFRTMCPDNTYRDSLGKCIESERWGVTIFPIYHPSPRNLSMPDRAAKFAHDIAVMCKIVRELT